MRWRRWSPIEARRLSAQAGAKITRWACWHLDDTASCRARRMAIEPPSSRFPSILLRPSRRGSLTLRPTMEDTPPVIRVEHLVKQFGDVVAVNDVSFDVRRGEIF